jgi:putative multiple sugar transport system substrate-binding protein
MAKKLGVLFLVVALMLSVAVGCAAPKAEAPAEKVAEEVAEAPAEDVGEGIVVGVAMPTKSLQRWNQDGSNMKDQLEAKGFEVDLQYAENEVAKQVEQLENMITKGVNALVIASIDGVALGPVLQEAKAEGIPVIAYDRLIMESDAVDYYATFDNYMVGTIQGQYVIDTLGLADGEVGPFNMEVFAGSPDDNNAVFFNKGAMDALQPYIDSGVLNIVSGQTDFQVIAIQGWTPEGAQDRMDNLLTAFYADKEIDVVLSPNDSLAQGIAASLGDREPYPVITGQDCDVNSMKNILAGKQSMSIFKDTRTLAAQVVDMVTAIVEGNDVPVNDTETYDNGLGIVPSYLCTPVFADINNYEELLIDSGYYTADQLQ